MPVRSQYVSEIFTRLVHRLVGFSYRGEFAINLVNSLLWSRFLKRADVANIASGSCYMLVRSLVRRGVYVILDYRAKFPGSESPDFYLDKHIDELRICDEIWVNSTAVRDQMYNAFGEGKRVEVIPLGVDEKRFSPESRTACKAVPGPYQILFVGTFSHRKGVDILLEAAANLPFDAQVTLVGTIDRDFWSECVARQLLTNRITHLGTLGGDELVSQYRNADLFVLPSRNDAFGLVALEALACGTPVVCTSACGISSYPNITSAGAIIEPSSVELLIKAIIDIRVRNNVRLSVNARSIALENTWSIYESAVESRITKLVPRQAESGR